MASSPIPAAPEQRPLGALARVSGVFFDPKNAFADIVRKPSWLAPMIILMVIWAALNVAFVQRVDWMELSKDQIAKNRFASAQFDRMDDAQKDRAYAQAAQRTKVTRYVRAVIGWPLLIVMTAGIYFGAYKLFAGARLNFATAFAISTFGHLPDGLRELLGVPVTWLKDPHAIDPDNFLASNPAALLGSDAPIWQLGLLAPLDLFSFWSLILIAIGFSMADPKKVPLGKSFAIAGGLYLLLIILLTTGGWILS